MLNGFENIVQMSLDIWLFSNYFGSYFGGFIHKWTHSGADF